MTEKDQYYRELIVDIGKRLTEKGVVGTFEGNISAVDREAGKLYITPSGQAKEFLTPEMIIICDMDGNYISRRDDLKSSSETVMHAAVYKMRPDVNGVVHCHAPFCTAFAVNNTPITTKAIAEVEIMFGGEIPVLPFGEPGTVDIVAGYKDHLDKNVVLLANHGMLAVGKDLKTAYGNTITVEMIAKILYYSRTMGTNVDIAPEELAKLPAWMSKQAARD